MTDDQTVPIRIGVISGGPTHHAGEFADRLGVKLQRRDDFDETKTPNDVGIVYFLALINAVVAKASSSRPFAFCIVGNANTRMRMREAFALLLADAVDIIAIWTVSPLLMDGPPEGADAFDDLLHQAIARNVAVVVPGPTGLRAREPGVLSVNGVIATAPYLDVCATPTGWATDAAPLAAWGDWESMRRSWHGTGINPVLPERFPEANGHSLAVWSIVAGVAGLHAVTDKILTLDTIRGLLRSMCVPIVVRPEVLTPSIGFFEPRQLDVRAVNAGRR